jgi:hypothetical protein
MDLIDDIDDEDDIEIEGEIMRRTRVLPVVVIVLATLVVSIVECISERRRNMRKRTRDAIPFYKHVINSNETDCHDQIRMTR